MEKQTLANILVLSSLLCAFMAICMWLALSVKTNNYIWFAIMAVIFLAYGFFGNYIITKKGYGRKEKVDAKQHLCGSRKG